MIATLSTPRTALRAALLAASALLAACDGPRQISESGAGAYEVSLAPSGDGLAAAWYDTRDGNAEIYMRLLDAQGRGRGAEIRLTDTPDDSYGADLAAIGADDLAIAWYEKDATGALHARLGVWSRTGTSRWQVQLSAKTAATRNPVVRAFRDTLFCAWIEKNGQNVESVWAGWWNADGTARSAPVRLGPAGATTWNLNAAVDDAGGAYVVYDTRFETQAEEAFVASLIGGHEALQRLTPNDEVASKYPDIALSNGRAAVTWYDERGGNSDVYLAVVPIGHFDEFEHSARRVTEPSGHSIGAYLAWNGERIGLAWSNDTLGRFQIYFASFDASGVPLEPPRQLVRSGASSLIPAIRPWRDGFAIAWNDVQVDSRGKLTERSEAEIGFAR